MEGTGEGYAQAGAATFDTAVNWLLWGWEQKEIEKWRKEDYGIAETSREQALRQQSLENRMAQQGQEFAEDQFNFGKQKWGEEFALTKAQSKQALKSAKGQEARSQEAFDIDKKRQSLESLKSSLNNVLGNDIEMKRMVAQRMGA